MSASAAPDPNQVTLITSSVLTGLTPLIPVPLVDDLVEAYFRRAMVRALAESHGVTLDRDTLDTLTRDPQGCCLLGCITGFVLSPFKLIFRKLLMILEWKRTLDLTSHTYHYGYLVDTAFQEGYLNPRSTLARDPETVRQAIDRVCKHAPIRPVEAAVGAAFRQSRESIFAAARLLASKIRRAARRRNAEAVARAIEPIEQEERRELRDVVSALQEELALVPKEHFDQLREQLRSSLDGMN